MDSVISVNTVVGQKVKRLKDGRTIETAAGEDTPEDIVFGG